MSELVVRPAGGMTFPQKLSYAEQLANSNLLPKQYQKQPANILFALEYAEALGLPAINAITSIHVVEGKPTASADLIASMVRKAGHKLRVSGDDTQAVAQIIRADDPDFVYEARWDMGKARAAGLASKNVWKSYPAAMLRSRAITEVARMGASDALYGVIYTAEEVGAQVTEDGTPVAPGPVIAPPPVASASDRLRAAMHTPEPEPGPVVVESERADDGITRPQLTALNAGMTTDLGLTKREDKLQWLTQQLDRPVTSSSELSKTEAHDLIDLIKQMATPQQPDDFVEEPPESWQPGDDQQEIG